MSTYPSFGRGVLVAAGITLVGTVAATIGTAHLGISLMALAYLCHILYHSPRPTGRVALFTTWLVGSVALSLLDSNLSTLLSFNIVSLWLARSWCHLDTILQALTDLALWATSMVLATAAVMHSASYPLGIWTFFLVQALWPWVAAQSAAWTVAQGKTAEPAGQPKNNQHKTNKTPEAAFNEAKSNAESALRRLQTQSETYHAS